MLLQNVDGVNLFGLISIASLLYCAPAAVVMEGAKWGPALQAAVTKMGSDMAFYQLLAWGGLFYHLYNQVSEYVLVHGNWLEESMPTKLGVLLLHAASVCVQDQGLRHRVWTRPSLCEVQGPDIA